MKIETFSNRQKAELIFSLYFNPESEHHLDFNLFDTLEFFGAATEEEAKQLTELFNIIGERLWLEMKRFDEQHLLSTL